MKHSRKLVLIPEDKYQTLIKNPQTANATPSSYTVEEEEEKEAHQQEEKPSPIQSKEEKSLPPPPGIPVRKTPSSKTPKRQKKGESPLIPVSLLLRYEY